jgi:hypothetical protein
LLLADCARVTAAHAEPAAAVATTRARIRVRLVGALGRDATLRDRIQSWFDPSQYEVVLQGASYLDPNQVLAPDSGHWVEVWICERGQSLRLYFASFDPRANKPRYLLRDIALERGLDEVASEELAQAVHLSASALVEGEVMSSREQVEASLRETPAEAAPALPAAQPRDVVQPRRQSVLELGGGIGYGAALRGDEGFAHGPRGRFGLTGPQLGGLVCLNLVVPHTVTRPELDLKLWGGAALAALSWRTRLASSVTLTAFAGPALELVRYRASARSGSGFEPAAAATELRPELALGALLSFGHAPRVALVPELKLALTRTHYEAARAGRRETVARASRVAPSLALEIEL